MVDSPVDTFTEDLADTDPRHIGSYEVVARFRSSTTTRVFAARSGSSWAVLKWVDRKRSDFDTLSQVVADEAQALSFLRHPNIVRLLGSGEDGGGAWLAIELIRGSDLRRITGELRARRSRLPEKASSAVVIEALGALTCIHEARNEGGETLEMVHRDVDPSNILVSSGGAVSLTDFGMVWMRGRAQRPTLPGFVKGKFRYLAPEYIAGGTVSPLIDIYAVGVTLFELLFGGPWAAREEITPSFMKRIVHEGLPFHRLRSAGADPELVDIAATAAHRDPDQRFATAREMSRAIELWFVRRGLAPATSDLGPVVERLTRASGP
jgi:serine/threonine-protein kinase